MQVLQQRYKTRSEITTPQNKCVTKHSLKVRINTALPPEATCGNDSPADFGFCGTYLLKIRDVTKFEFEFDNV